MECYYKVRVASGVLDALEVNVLALALGEAKALLISVDNCGIPQKRLDEYLSLIHI